MALVSPNYEEGDGSEKEVGSQLPRELCTSLLFSWLFLLTLKAVMGWVLHQAPYTDPHFTTKAISHTTKASVWGSDWGGKWPQVITSQS